MVLKIILRNPRLPSFLDVVPTFVLQSSNAKYPTGSQRGLRSALLEVKGIPKFSDNLEAASPKTHHPYNSIYEFKKFSHTKMLGTKTIIVSKTENFITSFPLVFDLEY